MMRRILSIATALMLVCTLPVSVLAAEWNLAIGDITVSFDDNGKQIVSQTNGERKCDDNLIIRSNGETSNTITVKDTGDNTANITIQDVSIHSGYKSGIDVVGDSNMNLNVKGENAITAVGHKSGIRVSSGSLTITGYGKLHVTNTDGDSEDGAGAAIGSDSHENMSGDITINGAVNVDANSNLGAAIGSGVDGGMSGNITIEGNAKVNAVTMSAGAAIGSGYYGEVTEEGSITICGNSKVTITTNSNYFGQIGASIGSGSQGDMNGTIQIGDKTTLNLNGGTIGAGTKGKMNGRSSVPVGTATESASLFRVVDKDEKNLPFTENRNDIVLTIHCDRDYATLLAKSENLKALKAQGTQTIVFETENVTSIFAIEDIPGTGTLRLTHDGETVTFTLETDISEVLK